MVSCSKQSQSQLGGKQPRQLLERALLFQDGQPGRELRKTRRSENAELTEAKRRLERSEARFRDIIQRTADAIIVVDPAGTICFANEAAASLFGTPSWKLVGTLFGFPVADTETTEIDIVVGVLPRVAEMRVVPSEWEGREAYIASLRDVTERKRAEAATRQLLQAEAARAQSEKSARRFSFLAETSAMLSSTLDVDTTLAVLARLCTEQLADWVVIYRMNGDGLPHRTHVHHRDPALGDIATELCRIPIDPAGIHPVLEVMRTKRSRLQPAVTAEMLDNMSTNPKELELARSLGVESFMQVPMVARGRSVGAIAFVRGAKSAPFEAEELSLAEDVARRAAMAVDNAMLYDDANRANQAKADLLAVVSHDLRTPLTAIIGYSDLLLMGIPEPLPATGAEKLERVRGSAQHLLYLLNELLAFTRLDAGREEPHWADADACHIIREAQSVVEPLAQQQQLTLHVDLPGSPLPLRTDPDKLRQILLNLIGNAIKYTKKGSVSVKCSPGAGWITITVEDTGIGINQNDLRRIFEPFWQADPMQRARRGGSGLGLSVVKRLTSLLGGTIAVESTPGVGSRFVLSLPVSRSA
jgi:signal transduction histidine kinase